MTTEPTQAKKAEMAERNVYWCSDCKKFMPAGRFRPDPDTEFGYQDPCMLCQRKAQCDQ